MRAKFPRTVRRLQVLVFLVAPLLFRAGVACGVTLVPGAAAARVAQGSWRTASSQLGVRRAILAHAILPASTPQQDVEGEREPAHETLFKVINFIILAGALSFLLRKPLGEFLRQRSESIRKGLQEGRKALEASEAQLRAIEGKLRDLEGEISRFKAEAAQEMEAERERLRRSAAAEAERILEFAQAQIESATRAAKLELRVYAAHRAVELAEAMVRQELDEVGQRRMVSRFVGEVARKPN